jgi:hypothetical protein
VKEEVKERERSDGATTRWVRDTDSLLFGFGFWMLRLWDM